MATRKHVIAAILAAAATLPAASGLLPDRDNDPFSAFGRDWNHVTQEEGDILAESGRRNADSRDWMRCATNDYRIVCPGGYVTRWQAYEDEANQR
jgi:hypothetical protein